MIHVKLYEVNQKTCIFKQQMLWQVGKLYQGGEYLATAFLFYKNPTFLTWSQINVNRMWKYVRKTFSVKCLKDVL